MLPSTLNPQPSTLNPQPSTPAPESQTPNYDPEVKSITPNHVELRGRDRQERRSRPEFVNAQRSTLTHEPRTQNHSPEGIIPKRSTFGARPAGETFPAVDSTCRLLIVPLFRGSSRFERLILSHRSRHKVTCECNVEGGGGTGRRDDLVQNVPLPGTHSGKSLGSRSW